MKKIMTLTAIMVSLLTQSVFAGEKERNTDPIMVCTKGFMSDPLDIAKFVETRFVKLSEKGSQEIEKSLAEKMDKKIEEKFTAKLQTQIKTECDKQCKQFEAPLEALKQEIESQKQESDSLKSSLEVALSAIDQLNNDLAAQKETTDKQAKSILFLKKQLAAKPQQTKQARRGVRTTGIQAPKKS